MWVLNLETMEWTLVAVQGTKPRPRFGHSQIVLDDHNILIIGGCAGPNMVSLSGDGVGGPSFPWGCNV